MNELTHYLWEKSESEEAKMPEVFSMKMSLTRKMEIRKMMKMKLARIRLFLPFISLSCLTSLARTLI